MYPVNAQDHLAELRPRWLMELPQALVTGRGLIVEHHPEEPSPDWWLGAAAVVTDGTADIDGACELLVVNGLTPEGIEDPAVAKRLLRSVTGAVAVHRPILVFTSGSFSALKRAGRSRQDPWDLDVGALVAAEELIYLLSARCALLDDAGDGGAGAQYLTPIERRIADRLSEADVGFVAQAPIGPYVADFLVEGRLVVECDGAAWHDEATDAARDDHIRALGYPTVRFTGRAIHSHADRCLQRIRQALDATPAPIPTPAVPLTAAQRRGVVHQDGPALVVAPAGSGKTRVVAERVRRLTADGADPGRICAISFTNAAVDEMKGRLRDCPDVKLQTLNSLGNAICREAYGTRHPIDISKPKMPSRYDVLRRVLEPHQYQGKAGGLKYWWDLIASFRQSLEVPDLAAAPLAGHDQAAKAAAFMRIHARYEAMLQELGVCDFNGQVLDAVRLLAAEPLVRMHWSAKYDYWIVDEFQDLPAPKLALLRLLTSPARNLMVVGDDDQIIYGFAGATPLTFSSLERDWADMAPLPLDRNYRCPHDLVVRSGWLIARNAKRIEKHIEPDRPLSATDAVDVRDASTYERDALEFVQSCRDEGRRWSEIALLFRTRLAAAPVEQLLEEAGIPHRSLARASVLADPTVQWVLSWLHVVSGTATPDEWRSALYRPNRYLSKETVQYLIGEDDPLTIIQAGVADPESIPRKSTQNADMVVDSLTHLLAAITGARAVGPAPARILAALRLGSAIEPAAAATPGPSEGNAATAAVGYKVIERLCAQFDTVAELDAWLAEVGGDDLGVDDLGNPDPDVDEVILCTIHKAKGREWPAVAVVGPSEAMPDLRATTPDQQEEERRVAYVAATRARDRLLFSCSAKYAAELNRSPAGLDWATYKAQQLQPRSAQSITPAPAPATARKPNADPPLPVRESEPSTLIGALRRLWRTFSG